MVIKFAILNPVTGVYAYADTEQDRDTLLAITAWEFFAAYSHGRLYSTVEILEDGSEKWTAPDGQPVASPQQMKLLLERAIESMERIKVAVL